MSVEIKKSQLDHIPVSLIRQNEEALRTVDKEDERYQGLLASVRKNGIINPISVREIRNPANPDNMLYGLVDGLHRYTAAMDVGFDTIPAQVISLADADLLEAQILANVHKVETKPVEYTNALLEILSKNPLLTSAELASRLSKSSTWLTERLQLKNLDEKIAKLVDEGTIKLTNAYALAKLPKEEQEKHVDAAIAKSPTEFTPQIHRILQEIKQAKREGRKANTDEFQPAPYLQKLSAIKEEVDSPNKLALLIKDAGITNPLEAARLALQWVLHMDAQSISADRDSFNARKQDQKKRAEKRAAERKKQKEEAAAQKAADITQLK